MSNQDEKQLVQLSNHLSNHSQQNINQSSSQHQFSDNSNPISSSNKSSQNSFKQSQISDNSYKNSENCHSQLQMRAKSYSIKVRTVNQNYKSMKSKISEGSMSSGSSLSYKDIENSIISGSSYVRSNTISGSNDIIGIAINYKNECWHHSQITSNSHTTKDKVYTESYDGNSQYFKSQSKEQNNDHENLTQSEQSDFTKKPKSQIIQNNKYQVPVSNVSASAIQEMSFKKKMIKKNNKNQAKNLQAPTQLVKIQSNQSSGIESGRESLEIDFSWQADSQIDPSTNAQLQSSRNKNLEKHQMSQFQQQNMKYQENNCRMNKLYCFLYETCHINKQQASLRLKPISQNWIKAWKQSYNIDLSGNSYILALQKLEFNMKEFLQACKLPQFQQTQVTLPTNFSFYSNQLICYNNSLKFISFVKSNISDENFKLFRNQAQLFPNLKVLLLMSNQINNINSEDIDRFESLQYFDIRQNQLTKQSRQSLFHCKNNIQKKILF